MKSLKGIALGEALVEERGFRHDRRWMLADRSGRFISQREYPRMALISAVPIESGISISAEGQQTLEVSPWPDGKKIDVEVWGAKCQAILAGHKASAWLSDFLGGECNLVYMPEASKRPINQKFNIGNDIVSFADGYPCLLANESSLGYLAQNIGEDIPMDRFRPNLVISGAEAFAEDEWKRIKIGSAVFRVVKPCARCVVTTIDQKKGEFSGKQPLHGLSLLRKAKDVYPDSFAEFGLEENAVLFGQNLVPEKIGDAIKLGDRLEILL